MAYLQDYLRHIPEILFQHGVHHVILSPGSRNAPLILAFTHHQHIQKHSIVDERSAGYTAVGIAQVTHAPVALVCTSGTASLNFSPAIAEAFYQQLPLIILTADRPPEWIDQLENQTINQQHIYNRFVKIFYQMPVNVSESNEQWHANRIINEASISATTKPYGPVHINVPLREPLYYPIPEQSDKPRIIKAIQGIPQIPPEQIKSLATDWNTYKKRMIVWGMDHPDSTLTTMLERLAAEQDVVVLAENLSNKVSPSFISNVDMCVNSMETVEKETFVPDLVVSFGSYVVSKKLRHFLRQKNIKAHWHVGTGHALPDTFQKLTCYVKTSEQVFLQTLLEQPKRSNHFRIAIQPLQNSITEFVKKYVTKQPFCDLSAIHFVMERLPQNAILHLANSTPVRYSQFFPSRPDITYVSNRGTSGIDGCVSSAAGNCMGCENKPVYLLISDLAFLYDSNALMGLSKNNRLKVVLLNNKGGNIFKLLNTKGVISNIEHYFTTPQNVNIKLLVESFSVDYFNCFNVKELEQEWQRFVGTDGPAVLEINTDPDVNTKIYKGLYQN